MKNLTAQNISFYYPDGDKRRYILDDVSIRFERGVFYSIVGHSGSGKTTLLSLLAGLDRLQEGRIFIDDEDIQHLSCEEYRSDKVGIVFQSYNLVTYLTAKENVMVAMEIGSKVEKRNKEQIAYNILNYLGLDKTKSDRLITQLSGGEQQRVAIARVLASDVDYILADEPTGNLDEAAEMELIKIFQKLAHDHNKCVIVVTHAGEVAKMSDVIFRLKRGRLSYE